MTAGSSRPTTAAPEQTRLANPGGQSVAALNIGPTGHVFAVTRENVEHEQPHWYFPQQLYRGASRALVLSVNFG